MKKKKELILGVSLLSKNYATIRYFESKIYFYLVYFIVLGLGIGILILANLKKRKIKNIERKDSETLE